MVNNARSSAVVGFTLGLFLAAGGCAKADLGVVPFLCNPGVPTCPDGYECKTRGKEDVCVLAGIQTGPPTDGGGTTKSDVARIGDSGARLDIGSAAASVVVTEFMAAPQAVADGDGEYVELFNITGSPININGWTLKDRGVDQHRIQTTGGLVIPARGFLVVAKSKDRVKNGGVNVGYAYTGFDLHNVQDAIVLLDSGGRVIDVVDYSKANNFPISVGASISIANPTQDNNKGGAWCVETKAWSGSKGDLGSPGAGPGCR